MLAMVRWLLGFGLVAALAALAIACETQEPYAQCELDEEVQKHVCDGKGQTTAGTGTTSCVVTKHPHCANSVCMSFFNRPSVCTLLCTQDSECALGGVCWEFSEQKSFCVPQDQFCSVNKTDSRCAGG